jgi:hypothetical protein
MFAYMISYGYLLPPFVTPCPLMDSFDLSMTQKLRTVYLNCHFLVVSARSPVITIVAIRNIRNTVKHNAHQLSLVQSADTFLGNLAGC